MQVLHQSDLAISRDSQKMNHLRTKLSQKHSCSANDRVAQIEILLVCPLIDDKKLANKHARNNSVIVKIHIFHVNLLTTTTTTTTKQKYSTANILSPSAL